MTNATERATATAAPTQQPAAAAPAQAEQKPVVWTLRETLTKGETTTRGYLWFTDPHNCGWAPLYAAPASQPAQAELLTGEQIIEAGWRLHNYLERMDASIAFNRGVRFAEQHYGIKGNTP